MSSEATIIAAHDYPQLPTPPALALKKALRSPEVANAARLVLQAGESRLRSVVLKAIDGLASVAGDPAQLYKESHEIRGLAGNAGLASAAKIASLLCQYLDAANRAGWPVDPEVTALHIMALARAAHGGNDAAPVEAAVLRELSALVARKTTEITFGEVSSSFSAR